MFEFQVVINLSPIYLDNFATTEKLRFFCSQPKACHYGCVFQTGVERVLFLVSESFY
ncbi:putative protein YneK [Shigella flexneri]